MSQGDPRGNPPRPARAATMLESVEDLRAQVRRGRASGTAIEARPGSDLGTPQQSQSPATPAGDDAEPFRPANRPPMALLRVLDDGEQEGEDVRIRSSPFVIGRADGDLVIPHDPGMSGRHAEVVRSIEDGAYRWSIRDLQSTNGTFVRVSNSLLKHDQELLIGGLRLRFALATPDPSGGADEAARHATTQKWSIPGRPALPAAELVELTPQGDGKRHPIPGDEARIGRDPSRAEIVLDDPMVSPLHARISRDDRGRWTIHHERSLNGLWLRVREIPLIRGGQFQCGEQRFLIRIP